MERLSFMPNGRVSPREAPLISERVATQRLVPALPSGQK